MFTLPYSKRPSLPQRKHKAIQFCSTDTSQKRGQVHFRVQGSPERGRQHHNLMNRAQTHQSYVKMCLDNRDYHTVTVVNSQVS